MRLGRASAFDKVTECSSRIPANVVSSDIPILKLSQWKGIRRKQPVISVRDPDLIQSTRTLSGIAAISQVSPKLRCICSLM